MERNYVENKGNRYYLLSFLVLLVVVLGFFFYIKPLWDEVQSLALGRDDLLNQKMALQTKLDSLQQVQQQVQNGSEIARETSLIAIPEHLEEDRLMMDIVDLARKNDVSMTGINFGIPGESVPGQVATATINLNLTGTPGNLLGFLRGIEANQRKIVVNSIAVQNASAATGGVLANFSLNMEAYYQGLI